MAVATLEPLKQVQLGLFENSSEGPRIVYRTGSGGEEVYRARHLEPEERLHREASVGRVLYNNGVLTGGYAAWNV